MALQGFVSFTGATPVIRWQLYSGPGTVTFGDAAKTNPTASFSAPGVYRLLLSADDGIHEVDDDATVITVAPAIALSIGRAGANLNLSWTSGSPPYAVQRAEALPAGSGSGGRNGEHAKRERPHREHERVFPRGRSIAKGHEALTSGSSV